MKNKILRKYFILSAVTLIVFLVIGFFASLYITDLLRTKRVSSIPPMFVAKMVDQLDRNDRLNAVKLYEQLPDRDVDSNLVLFDQAGEVVYQRYELMMPPIPPEFFESLKQDFDSQDVFKFHMENRRENRPPPPMGGGMFFGFLKPPPRPVSLVIRLSGEPVYYVGVFPPPMRPPQGIERHLPILGPLLLVVSLLLGVVAAITLIYASVRKKIIEADKVISEIHKGNLKARFVINRKDEFGEAILRFNQMADEIENLVEHLKFVESARNKILQELTHDLRTPVASLKNLLETLDLQQDKIDQKTKTELTKLSMREVDYFEHLVEDLLLLAQVEEPKYTNEDKTIYLNEILDDVLADCLSRPLYKEKSLIVEKDVDDKSLEILGSNSLVYRLFRNVLENSLSFTNGRLKLELKNEGKFIRFAVIDDGVGFSDEQIAHYGERKMSRRLISSEKGERLSLGLGSVIIKKIAQLHRGEVIVGNIKSADGRTLGAKVEVKFLIG